jgi:hypothetical protein
LTAGRPGTPLPRIDIFAVVVKGQAVPVAEVETAVLAMERKVRPLAAESAGLVQGIFFLFEKAIEKCPYPADDSHTGYCCFSRNQK